MIMDLTSEGNHIKAGLVKQMQNLQIVAQCEAWTSLENYRLFRHSTMLRYRLVR